MPGTLFVVATPIGNLEDISARALRILREVAVIAAEDTRRTANLLARYGIVTHTTSLHEHNERSKTPSLVDRLQRGEDVALVSDAGTPTVSDPGRHLIREAIDAGLRVEPIPGPNAAVAALSVSGFPDDSFTFLGFPPSGASEQAVWFDRLTTAGRTVVFFESPQRIVETLRTLQLRAGDVPVVVAREMTKMHEQLVRGPISDVLTRLGETIGEATVVVDIGRMTIINRPTPPEPAQLLAEIGLMTAKAGQTRRKAITTLARRHGLAPNEVYEALERAKKSVE